MTQAELNELANLMERGLPFVDQQDMGKLFETHKGVQCACAIGVAICGVLGHYPTASERSHKFSAKTAYTDLVAFFQTYGIDIAEGSLRGIADDNDRGMAVPIIIHKIRQGEYTEKE